MFFIKTSNEDYLSMLPDCRTDEGTDCMRIRVFMTVANLEPAGFDNYRAMVDEARKRSVFCSEPQTGMES